jgi:hypothetical protein
MKWLVRSIAVALLVAPAIAHAEGRTSSLSWVRMPGADSCVATQDLARDVEERLGRTVFVSAAQADVSVEGHIEPNANGPGFHAVVSIRDAKGALLGTRELARPEKSCDEMRAPLALIIAVMIDPDAAMHPKPAPPPPPKPPEPTVITRTEKETVYVPVPTPPKVEVPARPPAPWHVEVDADFVAAFELLPETGAGIAATLLVDPPHVPVIEVHGATFFDNGASADRGARGTFDLSYGGLGVCPLRLRLVNERFLIHSCAAVDLGVMRVHATGFDTPDQNESRFFSALDLEIRAAVRVVGPLVFQIGVGGVFPFALDSYVFDRADGTKAVLFTQNQAAFVAGAGLGLSF